MTLSITRACPLSDMARYFYSCSEMINRASESQQSSPSDRDLAFIPLPTYTKTCKRPCHGRRLNDSISMKSWYCSFHSWMINGVFLSRNSWTETEIDRHSVNWFEFHTDQLSEMFVWDAVVLMREFAGQRYFDQTISLLKSTEIRHRR